MFTLTITKKNTLFKYDELTPASREVADCWGVSQNESPQLYYADGTPYCGETPSESHQIEDVNAAPATDQTAIREQAQEQENCVDAQHRALVIIMRAAFDSMGVPTMGDVNRYCQQNYRFTPAIDPDDWEEFFLMAWREVRPSLWNIDIDPDADEPTIRWVDDKPAA